MRTGFQAAPRDLPRESEGDGMRDQDGTPPSTRNDGRQHLLHLRRAEDGGESKRGASDLPDLRLGWRDHGEVRVRRPHEDSAGLPGAS